MSRKHSNKNHGTSKIIAYDRVRKDRTFNKNFNEMKEAAMENNYRGKASVCMICGCVRNVNGYIIDQVTSIDKAKRQRATVVVCNGCSYEEHS